MYCRQCGNKLLDNDKFCNKCGVKIVTDADSLVSQENNSFATSDYNSANHSAMKSFMDYSIVKFFIYSVAFLVIILVFRSPHDLLGTFCYQLGRAIGIFIFVLPILLALSKSKILIKSHKMEGFFLIALVDTLTISIFGEKRVLNVSDYMYFFGMEFLISVFLVIFYDKFIYKKT